MGKFRLLAKIRIRNDPEMLKFNFLRGRIYDDPRDWWNKWNLRWRKEKKSCRADFSFETFYEGP